MNYNKFYNAWTSYAKPKRELLLEESNPTVRMKAKDFFKLLPGTQTQDDLEKLDKSIEAKKASKFISGKLDLSRNPFSLTVDIDASGNATVNNHNGRHRARMLITGDTGDEANAIDKINLPGAEKEISVNVTIRNSAKPNATLADIKRFIGQADSRNNTVAEFSISSGTSSADISGAAADVDIRTGNFLGYSILSLGNEVRGVHRHILDSLNKYKDSSPQKYINFCNKVNESYAFTDSSGKSYTLVVNNLFPYKSDPTDPAKPAKSITFRINLEPHPITIYGSLEKANEQTYTIKKK